MALPDHRPLHFKKRAFVYQTQYFHLATFIPDSPPLEGSEDMPSIWDYDHPYIVLETYDGKNIFYCHFFHLMCALIDDESDVALPTHWMEVVREITKLKEFSMINLARMK